MRAAALLALNELGAASASWRSAHARGTALGLSFGAWHGVSAGLYVLACLGRSLMVWNENLR